MSTPDQVAAESWRLYRIGEMSRALLNTESTHPTYQAVRMRFSPTHHSPGSSTEARRELHSLTRRVSRWAMDWHKQPGFAGPPPEIDLDRFSVTLNGLMGKTRHSESPVTREALNALRDEISAIRDIRHSPILSPEYLDDARAFHLIEKHPHGRPDALRHPFRGDGTARPTSDAMTPRLRNEGDRLLNAAARASHTSPLPHPSSPHLRMRAAGIIGPMVSGTAAFVAGMIAGKSTAKAAEDGLSAASDTMPIIGSINAERQGRHNEATQRAFDDLTWGLHGEIARPWQRHAPAWLGGGKGDDAPEAIRVDPSLGESLVTAGKRLFDASFTALDHKIRGVNRSAPDTPPSATAPSAEAFRQITTPPSLATAQQAAQESAAVLQRRDVSEAGEQASNSGLPKQDKALQR